MIAAARLWRRPLRLVPLVFVLLLGLLSAAGRSSAADAPPDSHAPLIALPARPTIAPVMACAALATPATVYAGGTGYRILSATEAPARADAVATCVVKGYAAPQTQFELRLPLAGYTGRFLQGGCGGMCGVISDSIVPLCSNAHLASGAFAVAYNDGGHFSAGIGDGTWAVDPELRMQFAHKATHATALVSKAIIARFYGQAPENSYFVGCSGGGREALMETQRHPADFDGVVAGSSVSMPAAMQLFLWEAQKGLDAEGREIFTPAAVATLHRAVLAACDRLDGIPDGQIDDPRRCHYDPAALLCPADARPRSNCLTPGQVEAARAYFRGPTSEDGTPLFPGGAPYGSELGWVGPGAATQTGKLAAESFIKLVLLPGELPESFGWRDWRFTRAMFDRLMVAGAQFDPADPDLAAFRDRGGKLILWQGMADNAAGARGMLDYYQAVREHMGGLEATRRFARMFPVPGGYHCRGGYVPYDMDFLGAMVDWVERGVAPESVLAAARLADGAVRRRPLYAYPTPTRYRGGDVNDPRSFSPGTIRTEPDDAYPWPGSKAGAKRAP
ncbi:tannase/feruloyl esterase family alpha/beta hydrolase [Sphingomonas sp. MMS24-J13]|uniref:tannase/feruloyl esterase family alpha/beta hydrolase n=1 Tax=Sphingomonas sp. MMS24-J13 TaxID=3238686 RepID=UPI00385165E6